MLLGLFLAVLLSCVVFENLLVCKLSVNLDRFLAKFLFLRDKPGFIVRPDSALASCLTPLLEEEHHILHPVISEE